MLLSGVLLFIHNPKAMFIVLLFFLYNFGDMDVFVGFWLIYRLVF